jgi:hypothetical protein
MVLLGGLCKASACLRRIGETRRALWLKPLFLPGSNRPETCANRISARHADFRRMLFASFLVGVSMPP